MEQSLSRAKLNLCHTDWLHSFVLELSSQLLQLLLLLDQLALHHCHLFLADAELPRNFFLAQNLLFPAEVHQSLQEGAVGVYLLIINLLIMLCLTALLVGFIQKLLGN